MKKWLPLILILLCGGYLASALKPPRTTSGFNLEIFGALPALHQGRVKPIDSIARNSLILLSGKQNIRTPKGRETAVEWLMEMLWKPEQADEARVIEIADPDVLGLLGIEQTGRRTFTFNELKTFLREIEWQAGRADTIQPRQRSRFDAAILLLQHRLALYQRLENTLRRSERPLTPAFLEKAKVKGNLRTALTEDAAFLSQAAGFHPIPVEKLDGSGVDWISMGEGLLLILHQSSQTEITSDYVQMGAGYRDNDPQAFNSALYSLQSWLTAMVPIPKNLAYRETFFNRFEPFYKSLLIYVAVLVLVSLSFLGWMKPLQKSAFALLMLGFAVHTAGLIFRIIIQGRPPVTNLYSSAVFVGWVSVLLGIILERMIKTGVGTLATSAIGFLTLIVAHHLSLQGDTMEMMQAVLDSNFWLATHVVSITIGYGSTFIAGFIATIYLLRHAFDKHSTPASRDAMERMVYGAVCFSTFFSFLGTVLGGIWADQSWGRFWGWDPKENGALLIVLWNTFILHARNWKKISEKVIMMLAVVGNVVTALAWFGVNMLGIGLHSYGFMSQTLVWLIIFILSQMAIVSLGFFPACATSAARKAKSGSKGKHPARA